MDINCLTTDNILEATYCKVSDIGPAITQASTNIGALIMSLAIILFVIFIFYKLTTGVLFSVR